jgi:hypothetical protein
VNRVSAYQTAAARYGTVIERASRGVPPRIGGGITKHPLARATADALVKDLLQLGAEARICDPRDPNNIARVFVYLSGCSFQQGDLS